jgi:cell division protein FtsL
MNKLKTQIPKEEAEQKTAPETPTKKGALAKGVSSVLTGSFLTREIILKQLPFIFFLTLMAMVYIANTYYAEKTVRDINHLNSELKELQSEYITTKSELTSISKQSEVAKAAEVLELKESVVPPKKIVVSKKDYQKK